MSNKERAIQLLDRIPESKMYYVIAYLEGAAIPDVETVEPDEWDLKMIEEAEKENDGTGIDIEDLAADLGVNLYCPMEQI